MNATAVRAVITGLPSDGRVCCMSYYPAKFPRSDSSKVVSQDQRSVMHHAFIGKILRLMNIYRLMLEVLELKLGLTRRYRSTKDQESRVRFGESFD